MTRRYAEWLKGKNDDGSEGEPVGLATARNTPPSEGPQGRPRRRETVEPRAGGTNGTLSPTPSTIQNSNLQPEAQKQASAERRNSLLLVCRFVGVGSVLGRPKRAIASAR